MWSLLTVIESNVTMGLMFQNSGSWYWQFEVYDAAANKFSGVFGDWQYGYEKSHQWTFDPGGAAPVQGSFFRGSVCVLQPSAEYDQNTLLGQKRFLFMAQAVGSASFSVAPVCRGGSHDWPQRAWMAFGGSGLYPCASAVILSSSGLIFLSFLSIKCLQNQTVMLCTGHEFGSVEPAWWCRRA